MLSVVLATYNEEKNLANCLDSVTDIADEIIIVDGESRDQTVAVAKKYKATVITTNNKPNFHINKQMAMDAANGTLVLQLDADEQVDEELASFISKLDSDLSQKTKLQNIQPKAWWVKRKNYFLGAFLKKGGQYPDSVIRLYINGYAKLPQKDVHEQMVVDGDIGIAKGHLIHLSNPTFADYLRKFNTYTSFKAQQLADENLQLSILTFITYFLIKPTITFFTLFVRHKGFVDKMPGFIFATMSGMHHQVAYLKLWELYQLQSNQDKDD